MLYIGSSCIYSGSNRTGSIDTMYFVAKCLPELEALSAGLQSYNRKTRSYYLSRVSAFLPKANLGSVYVD